MSKSENVSFSILYFHISYHDDLRFKSCYLLLFFKLRVFFRISLKSRYSSLNIYLAALSLFDTILLVDTMIQFGLLQGCWELVIVHQYSEISYLSGIHIQHGLSIVLESITYHLAYQLYCTNLLSLDMCRHYDRPIFSREISAEIENLLHSSKSPDERYHRSCLQHYLSGNHFSRRAKKNRGEINTIF